MIPPPKQEKDMVLANLIAPATKILDKFIPDADTKNKLAHELATIYFFVCYAIFLLLTKKIKG